MHSVDSFFNDTAAGKCVHLLFKLIVVVLIGAVFFMTYADEADELELTWVDAIYFGVRPNAVDTVHASEGETALSSGSCGCCPSVDLMLCSRFIEVNLTRLSNGSFARAMPRGGAVWQVVTSTSIGYGDITPVSEGGRIFLCFYMLFSTVLTAGILGEFIDVYVF